MRAVRVSRHGGADVLDVVEADPPRPRPGQLLVEVAAMLQGLTAHYLVSSTYPVAPGETVLIHAAAGGVGLLLVQMVKLRGGRVLATVSSSEKENRARDAGANEVIRYDREEVVD